jgi:hypothetical protein
MLSLISLFLGGLGLMCLYHGFTVVHHLLMVRDPDNFLRLTAEDVAHRSDVTQTCDAAFAHIPTIHNVHTFEGMKKVIAANKNRDALLFKGFLLNPEKQWADIAQSHENVSLSFTTLNFTSYGSMWTAGVKSGEKVEMSLGEFLTAPQDPTSKTALYASFIQFLQSNVVVDATGKSIEEFIDVRADTNFLSNFPRDVLATPIHAAPLGNSFAFLYAGRKFWLMASPESMEKYHAINTPSTMLLSGSEKTYFTEEDQVLVADQEPGDLLYFPGHWGHAVVTKEGPNAMCVLREGSAVQSFMRQPWRTIEAVIALKTTDAAVRVFSHKHVSSVQKTLLMADSVSSPCADKWSAWMRT